MANVTCKLCDKTFEEEMSFHKHLRQHKTTQTAYYQTYYPRYDLYDHTIIRYKNKEYYFSTEFNSKGNFKRWLSTITPEEAKSYVRKFLEKRKAKKGLVFAPTQVELKTLMVPGINYINKNLGGYDVLCESLGLKKRFNNTDLDHSLFTNIESKVIFRDTREQTPLEFDDNTTRWEGMSFGDYRMAGSNTYIERKSLGDAWGTLTGGKERFEREIQRALEAGAYLVVLIEVPFGEIEKYPLQRHLKNKIRIPPEFVYHTIRDLSQKYLHIQFLFVKNRDEASRVVTKIFSAGEQVRQVDLQLLYDLEKL